MIAEIKNFILSYRQLGRYFTFVESIQNTESCNLERFWWQHIRLESMLGLGKALGVGFQIEVWIGFNCRAYLHTIVELIYIQLQSLFTYKSVGLHLGFQLSLPVGGPVSAFEAWPSADSADIAWASLLGYYDSFCRKWFRDV